MKPGIDWVEIRERYKSGETPYQIAKDVDVTRQAIMKRAAKENWDKPKTVTINPGNWLPTVTEFNELQQFPLYTEEKVSEALELIAIGANHSVASAAIGISRETWRRWRDACPKLETAIEEAQAHHARKALMSIARAADGDWKAAERQLASNPLTKDDYAQKDGKTGISVTFNINRASPEEIEQTHKVIDVTPE